MAGLPPHITGGVRTNEVKAKTHLFTGQVTVHAVIILIPEITRQSV